MSMDVLPLDRSDPHDEDLSDEARALVKAELEPGERLLWAARPLNRDGRFSGAVTAWSFVAVVLAVVGAFSWVEIYKAPLQHIGGLLFLGLCAGVLDLFIALVLAIDWNLKRRNRERLASTLYALTDRRAVIWTPQPASTALKVVTTPKGGVSGVHRVEYPDGSGDVLFNAKEVGSPFGDEYRQTGFLGVAEVRRVEDQVRRTLVVNFAGEVAEVRRRPAAFD